MATKDLIKDHRYIFDILVEWNEDIEWKLCIQIHYTNINWRYKSYEISLSDKYIQKYQYKLTLSLYVYIFIFIIILII